MVPHVPPRESFGVLEKDMANLIDKTIEVHTPRRYEITGKVDGHKIKKVGYLEAIQQINVSPYSSRWVTGYVGS